VAHLRPRTNTLGAVARVRHSLSMAIHRYFHEHGYVWVHTPIITASDAEGAGEMFRVSYARHRQQRGDSASARRPHRLLGRFLRARDLPDRERAAERRDVLLCAVQGLHVRPDVPAENSNTSRHLAEFWMVEPELAFADLSDNADLAESFLKYIFTALLAERRRRSQVSSPSASTRSASRGSSASCPPRSSA
jgi:asparaginyl-tRNA synthetase